MNSRTVFLIAFAVTLTFTALMLYFLIPVLKKMKIGQRILDIGPDWHKSKEGTPTMGGIAFLISVFFVSVVSAFLLKDDVKSVLTVVSYAVVCGLIGVIDDVKKLKMKRNEGLTALQKFALQLVSAAVFIVVIRRLGVTDTAIYVPFYDKYLDLGWSYYLFSVLFLTGFENAVNLTDGIDGLCASVTAAVMLFFAAFGIKNKISALALISFTVLGGCIGFLIFNVHPARVFMGDTGSLFLGAVTSGLALSFGEPLLMLAVGAVYVIEAASVIIQVLYFKLTGKRFFLMAPFHHHLEKKGMSENRINAVFITVTAVIGAICYYFW